MKFKIHPMLLCVAAVGGTTYSNDSEAARTCRAKVTLPTPSAGTCDVDSSNPKMGNPFAYIDPTQGCDFSFSLPGLPSFSLDGLQGMLCQQIQDIGQQAINDTLAPILDQIPSSIDLDMKDMMSNMFDDQMKMQREFCPVYNASGKLVSYKCENTGIDPNPGLPDWALPIVDPDNKNRECYELGGVTYCKPIGDGGNTTPDIPDTPSNPDQDLSLPHCSDLTDFFDPQGNLIQCRNSGPRADSVHNDDSPSTYSAPSWQSQTDANTGESSSLKPTWNTKKGW